MTRLPRENSMTTKLSAVLVSTATVALDYRHAVCHASEFEEQGSAILSLVPTRRGHRTKRARRVGPGGANYRKVRFHIDVEDE